MLERGEPALFDQPTHVVPQLIKVCCILCVHCVHGGCTSLVSVSACAQARVRVRVRLRVPAERLS